MKTPQELIDATKEGNRKQALQAVQNISVAFGWNDLDDFWMAIGCKDFSKASYQLSVKQSGSLAILADMIWEG